jgi:hypothetical protein
VGEPSRGRSVCARCHAPLTAPYAMRICEDGIVLDDEPISATSAVASSTANAAPDDWQLRQRSKALGRQLRREGAASYGIGARQEPQQEPDSRQHVFDELRELTSTPLIMPNEPVAARRQASPRRPEGGQYVAWGFAALGTTALGCGIGTIGWSLSAVRPELWNPAVGLTLTGQGLLILGLVMLVARLWRTSRNAAETLHTVHTDLSQLQRTADALTAMRSGGAPTFYAELVRGASPQMLLANLKGQLDQLATRLGGIH